LGILASLRTAITRAARLAMVPVRSALAYLTAPPVRRMPARSGDGRMITKGQAREQQIRSLLGWGPRDYRAALAQADGGDLSRAADIWDSVWGTDDRVIGCVDTRILQLLGCKLTFEASGDGRRKGKAVRAAEADGDWYEIFEEAELKTFLGWWIGLNVALIELVWTERDPVTGEEIARIRSGRNVPRAKTWHPRCLRYDWDERCWYVRLENFEEVKVRNGDGRFVLFLGGDSRPWARGLWRSLALLYLLKADAQVDWARHNEKYANGVIVVEGAEGADDDLRTEVANDIVNLGAEGVIALPIGFKASVLQTRADAHGTFQAREDASNAGIAIVVLGGNLTTESKDGADTGAQAQQNNQGHRLRGDAEQVSTALREGAMCPWAWANFGDRELAPWPLYQTAPPEDRAALVSVWDKAADALIKLETLYVVDWKDAKDRAGLPITGLRPAPKPAPAPIPVDQPEQEAA
jgi:hypothetical protein